MSAVGRFLGGWSLKSQLKSHPIIPADQYSEALKYGAIDLAFSLLSPANKTLGFVDGEYSLAHATSSPE